MAEKEQPEAQTGRPIGLSRFEVYQSIFVAILVTLVILAMLLAIFWDRICAKIVIHALECGVKQVAAPNYRPSDSYVTGRDYAVKQLPRQRQLPKSPEVKEPVVWKKGLLGEELVREARPGFFVDSSNWTVIRIMREPSHDPNRSWEYDYVVMYRMPNGASESAWIKGEPLTVENIKKAVLDDIEERRKLPWP